MDALSFDHAFQWVQAHSYFFIFLAMLVEGPVVTAAAGFAAALGKLSFPIVLFISFWGDLIGDVIYYAIGYWGRGRVVEKYGHRLGLTHARIEKIEHYLKRHTIKGLIISKWLPVVPTLALTVAGAIRLPFDKFLLTVTLIIIPRTILFAALGFYFGRAYDTINRLINNFLFSLLVVGLGFLVVYVIYKALARRLAKTLDGVDQIS